MKYGFIGCGNMGGALAKALAKSTTDILIADKNEAVKDFAAQLGAKFGTVDQAAACEYVFLAVKPQMVEAVLAPLQGIFADRKPVLISMAAGLSVAQIQAFAGNDLPIIRIMPNTPCAVGKGMISYCYNTLVTEEMIATFLADMEGAGRFEQLPENLMEAATAVAGCGPAFMYMFIEAMADGAVVCGLPRDKAIAYAAATMEGAARMVLETGIHPGALKDAVCSPGGSTIVGVKTLEENGFRGAVMDCVKAAYEKSVELGKK